MKKWAILGSLLASLTLGAQSFVPSAVYLTFTPGLEMTDGSPFDESVIEKYSLYCDGAYVKDYANDFSRQVYVTIDDIGVGSHTCSLSEWVGGLESLVSNTVDFPLGQRTPKAPTNLAVVPGA
jgi:hypothetical protein